MNLDEARRLHDRSQYDPGICATCLGSLGEGATWPCPTATALGATGRSEWTNTTSNSAKGFCRADHECTGPNGHPGGCTYITNPCGMLSTREQGSYGPCVRDDDHDRGGHRDVNGDQW